MWLKCSQTAVINAMYVILFSLLLQYEDTIKYELMCKKRSEYAPNIRKKERVTFDEVATHMSKYQFRRMLRMTRECFDELFQTIICAVGEKEFKS